MTSHPCHASGCSTLLSPRAAFCSRHGRMLPLLVHSRLLAAAHRQSGAEYEAALREAIATVASREQTAGSVER